MLSFISFWRAAAIVLNDLGSSAFYVGGIAEKAVGRAAPWFILAVMLFSYAVRAVYVESCAMFTRGGVYRVVKEAMGGTLAKLSVSALMFDYVLTGPISGVSAGQYIVGLVAQTSTYLGIPCSPSPSTTNLIAAGIAIFITIYFWRRNTRGLHESSGDALKIMYVTTAMVIALILWSGITIISSPDKRRIPPAPVPSTLAFNPDAVGWLPDVAPRILRELPSEISPADSATPEQAAPEPRYGIVRNAGALIGLIGILMALGHSFLAMSGEESLAQVNRELEYPKHKNLMRAGLVIFVYSLLFTSLVSFFAYAIIPDDVRPRYLDNLISGISMYLVGPMPLKLLFQGFIVIVGFLMLAGAINTSIIGSFKGLAVMVLRFKDRSPREWKVPFNIRLDGNELPIGLGVITALLFSIAGINLITKEVATIAGVLFTLVFFVIFTVSEKINQRKLDASIASLDQFKLNYEQDVTLETVHARPGNILVAVRDYNTLEHLDRVLSRNGGDGRDIVVMTARLMTGPGAGERDLYDTNLFTDYEQRLFTRVVALAEKHGRPVNLLVTPASNIFDAVAQTALRLDSVEVVAGLSAKASAQEQARQLGRAWERLAEKPRRQVRFSVMGPEHSESSFYLGAHAPALTEEDVQLIHRIWLEVSKVPARSRVHHRDVVRVALERLFRDLHGKSDVMLDFYRQEQSRGTAAPEALLSENAASQSHGGGDARVK
ncbi:MAG: APC family permease [Blastocatellia bacterium AA13]|nr:MAG: APC family permease [Blastocatellia bacterium AA13]